MKIKVIPAPLVKADWEEDKHPRADDGKFGSKTGGGADTDKPKGAVSHVKTGSQTHKIPPSAK
jgi:hypothetical protein